MSDVETYEHNGVPVTIGWEEDGSFADPRENSNLGTILHWHRHYDLGEQIGGNEEEAIRRGGLRLLDRYLRLARGATCVIPIGMIDHSGISIYAGGGSHWCDPGGWDSGTVGVIFDTPESREEIGTPLDRIEEVLLAEIKEYDLYLRGEVYWYQVGSEHYVEESCGGFIGYEYAKEAANEAADNLRDDYMEKIRIARACIFADLA